MKKQLATILILSAALFGCAKAEQDDHAATHTDTTANTHAAGNTAGNTAGSAAGSAATGTMEERMQAMNAEMVNHLGPADAEYDHRFIDMMIPHHEGAILMAKDALQKSQRPEIKKLAEDIIVAQEKEIAQLKAWGEAWYHKH